MSEDGKYFGHLTTLGRSNIFREFDIEGTWQIQDGFLIDTMTKHSGQTNVNLHSVCRAQIIQFSDQELVTKFEENNPKDSNDGHVTIFQKTKD